MDNRHSELINIDELIQLAKIHKSWKNLCKLIIQDSIEIINSKSSKLINNFDQDKVYNIQYYRILPKSIFNEKYKKILEEIKLEYDKIEPNLQFNIKILRKLENIEEVLNVYETKGVSKALDVI